MKVLTSGLFRASALTLALAVPAGLGLGPAALAAPGSMGSAQNQSQQPPKPAPPPDAAGQTPPGTPPASPAVDLPKANPAEEADYKTFYALKTSDSDPLIQQGEDFLKKYPGSLYRASVYSRLAMAYFSKRDMDKMYASGEKGLELNPDDVDVLSLLGWVLPHTYNPNELDAEQKLVKAEQYSKHALELLANLPKPEGLTDEAFANTKKFELARGHSGLGLVYFRRGKFEDSIAEMKLATQLNPSPDPVDYYVMGFSLQQLKRPGDAVTAFQKCAEIQSSLQGQCNQNMEEAKKQAAAQPAPAKP